MDIKVSEVDNEIPNSSNLVNTTGLNTKIGEVKNEIPDHAKYITTLATKDYIFFLDRMWFPSKDGSQNLFVYQATLDLLESKRDKGTDYILSWKSKGVNNSKLKPLYPAFLHSVKRYINKLYITLKIL